jgi:RepB plasmid partitioning protein
VEPPVVARSRDANGKFLLLDGHLRLEVLRDRGSLEIDCLVSTEDEAFTYNKRVNRIAIIQEHRMILKAVANGVSEARIAKALNVDVASIRRHRKLLDGICSEAVELLKEKHLALNTFSELRKLCPIRHLIQGRGIRGCEVMELASRALRSKSLIVLRLTASSGRPRRSKCDNARSDYHLT